MPPFARFFVMRLAIACLLLLGITFVTFSLSEIVPGDPAVAALGMRALEDPAAVHAFRQRYGLDKPAPVRYAYYLGRLVHGDLGESQQSQRPVLTDLRQYVPATAELALVALLIAAIVGVALGVAAAMRENGLADQVLRVGSLIGLSVPIFWLALLALSFFFVRLGWAPGSGRLSPGVLPPPTVTGLYTADAALAGQWGTLGDALRHLILPALVLAAPLIALLIRFTRSAVLDVVGKDYVLMARAKGLGSGHVTLRYVLRAALPPIVTVIGVLMGTLLAGTVFIEDIFNWPGIGKYIYTSSVSLDRPAIMGASLFVAGAYITINFIVDVTYHLIDPRLKL